MFELYQGNIRINNWKGKQGEKKLLLLHHISIACKIVVMNSIFDTIIETSTLRKH